MASVLITDLVVTLLPFADSSTPDPVPDASDVTAGGTALLVFLFLILAGVVLARSFVKQLRKAQAARDAGVYGDPPAGSETSDPADESNEHRAPS